MSQREAPQAGVADRHHAPPDSVCLDLLDRFCMRRDNHEITPSPGEQRLLAFLAVRGNTRRALVAGTLWPEVTEVQALASLRTALWRLHRACPTVVATNHDALMLDRTITVDLTCLVEVMDDVFHGCDNHVELLLELHGELLPGWYDDWVLYERTRLRQLWLHAVELAGTRRLSAGDHLTALRAGLEAVRADPWRESAHRLVAQVHQAEGNHMDAIHQIEACRALLADSGIAPSTQLGELANTLRVPRGGTPARRTTT
jgi:DNA-binding SARP family transcriptional activator